MKIVIVGAVAGGASAATKLRRNSEEVEILVFEKGPFISFANCGLPYHIGGKIKNRDALILQTPESFKKRFNIDVLTNHEVLTIDSTQKQVLVKNLITGEEFSEKYDKLLLSPGAKPVIPEHLDSPLTFTLRNIPDMDKIIATIKTNKPQHITVCGGGFIGIEMIEAITQLGIKTTLLERGAQIMAPVDFEMAMGIHSFLREKGIDLRLNQAINKLTYDSKSLHITTDLDKNFTTDMLIVAIGVKPDIDFTKSAGLKIGEFGGIVVNEKMETSVPDIYAVGDAIETPNFITQKPALVPLAGPANRQGRIAADVMLGKNNSYKNTQATSICKVFDLTVASTGLNEKQLIRESLDYEKVYIYAGNHAGYYPDAQPILLKLLFCEATGEIFGAQAVGKDGVDKRIDVLASAQRARLTVFDLQDLELSYAPPFGSARDILNQAGMVASNVISGDTEIFHISDLKNLTNQQFLLDVRTPEEISRLSMIPSAVNIPLNDLRTRVSEVPKDKEIYVYCQVGLRGHVAYRMLKNLGFRVKNLVGGYNLWSIVNKESKNV